MKREQRLRREADFARVRRAAPRGWSLPSLALYAAPNDLDRSRVGVVTSRRLGGAVVRNRVRRRLREILRLRYDALRPGFDLVLVARPPSVGAAWPDLCQVVDTLLGRARLWRTPAAAAASPSVGEPTA